MASINEIDGALVSGLLVLSAVAEAHSFVGAAERLGMTQPGVSRAIARLEERLAARLVQRSSRHVRLTDVACALLDRVAPHLRGIGEAATEASDSSESVRGRLRVSADPLVSRMVLAPQLTELLHRNSGLELRIETRPQLSDLLSDGFDLALKFGEPATSTLVARRLLNPRILTVAAPSYLERRGWPRHPADLGDGAHECILAIDTATGRLFTWEFWREAEVLSITARGSLTVADAGTKLGACLAGFGVAQVIDIGVDRYLRTGELVNLFPDWPDEHFPLFVYYPSRRHLPAKARVFIDFVVNSLAAQQGQTAEVGAVGGAQTYEHPAVRGPLTRPVLRAL